MGRSRPLKRPIYGQPVRISTLKIQISMSPSVIHMLRVHLLVQVKAVKAIESTY